MTYKIQKVQINENILTVKNDPKLTKTHSRSLLIILKNTFLPINYPHSVSKDYLKYQIFDTLQALCSSLNGSLATYTVLKTSGVGNNKITVLSTTLNWLIRDGTGMLSSIIFTYFNSNFLDYNPKQWRLVADIFNDIAMLCDIIIKNPYFLFISSIFRSIVGVAGNSTRMQITLHQSSPMNGKNIGDVNAKDGAQETLVNLFALILNLILVPVITTKFNGNLMIPFFSIFVVLHIIFNYLAVRSVKSELLNLHRLFVILEEKIYDVEQVNDLQPIFSCILRSLKRPKIYINQELCHKKTYQIKYKCLNKKFIILQDAKKKIFYVNFSQESCEKAEIIIKSIILVNSGFKIEKAEEIFEKIRNNDWNLNEHRFDVGNFCVDSL